MPYTEDMLGALFLIASLHAVKDVTETYEYHIVAFEGTTATLMIDASKVTTEEIQAVIAEAQA